MKNLAKFTCYLDIVQIFFSFLSFFFLSKSYHVIGSPKNFCLFRIAGYLKNVGIMPEPYALFNLECNDTTQLQLFVTLPSNNGLLAGLLYQIVYLL